MSVNEFKTVGIALDKFKVKRFRTVLAEKGYQTKLKPGVTRDSATLIVKGVTMDQMDDLQQILVRLQYEFANRN